MVERRQGLLKGDICLLLFLLIFIIKHKMKNILISEKQLESLVNNVKTNINEHDEQGSYMAKKQLYTIATLAYKMWESMEEGEQLEDWMETKIAQCEQSIISVVKNFMYDEFVGETESPESSEKLNLDDLIIGK